MNLNDYFTFHYLPQWEKKRWDLLGEPFNGTYEEAKEELKKLLRVEPEGKTCALLSGGLDSSTAVALYKGEKLETFAVGYDVTDLDLKYAAEVSRHVKTKHYEVLLRKFELMNSLDTAMKLFDKPCAETGILPLFIMYGMLKQRGFDTILTGDGGDELFLGYPWHRLLVMPLPKSVKEKIFNKMITMTNKTPVKYDDMLTFELQHHLVDNHMYVAETLSKHIGIKIESPFLKEDMVKFAHSLPIKWRLNKRILRDVMADRLPNANRKKMHFQIPKLAEGPLETRILFLNSWIKSHITSTITG